MGQMGHLLFDEQINPVRRSETEVVTQKLTVNTNS